MPSPPSKPAYPQQQHKGQEEGQEQAEEQQKTPLTKAPRGSHPAAPKPSQKNKDTVVFSARIPRELKRQVKSTAAQRDQSVQELVVEALQAHIDNET